MVAEVGPSGSPSLAKPAQVVDDIRRAGIPFELLPFAPLAWEAFERVHAPWYVRMVRTGEPPELAESAHGAWSPALAESLRWQSGSMVAAALGALGGGAAVSPSAGFHHAHYDRSGAFCLLNGYALGALEALEAGAARVLLLDCDHHFGNGTEDILARLSEQTRGRVEHLSFGRRLKRRSQAGEYMAALGEVCRRIGAGTYGLVLYQAGMDVLVGDPMGGILTYAQAYQRDLRVFEACRASSTAIAWNLAGGYWTDESGAITPVLRGHRNTFIACAAVFDGLTGLQPELGTTAQALRA